MIHCEREGYQSGGTLTIHNGDRADIHDVSYEDIRIEDSREKIFDLKICNACWSHDPIRGQIRNVLFKDIAVVDGPFPPSIIRGFESETSEFAVKHTDAVQAFGRIPLALSNVDAVSIASHKIGGPVGVGALAVRSRVALRPQSFGGGQEQGRRAGTQDVRGALAFAAAARDCLAHLEERRMTTARNAGHLVNVLCAPDTGIHQTVEMGFDAGRLPGMVSLLVDGVDSETLVLTLDEAGFEVSAGSACSSGNLDPSHVLLAMGIPRNEAFNSLRISFDERVDDQDLMRFAETLMQVVSTKRYGR